ncbi:uncharacterized protein LOC110446529 [Mizuhopecten yessoensis]|uniref:uncharacterized protein LOC110446529 n=1 Tax=Mizuhopecten yessoensis TaxID=6573 RepID=UPI000B45A34A|nr:uncharacterized protein LOC110446529 [Mizuhopecten yessoensis]
MSDQGELYEKSWILYNILDRYLGSPEDVTGRRSLAVSMDQLVSPRGRTIETFSTGSKAEGYMFWWADKDIMHIDKNVIVICPGKDISNQRNSANKSVVMMREAYCRPGYVNLELLQLGQMCCVPFAESIVLVGDALFISSEIHKQACHNLFDSTLEQDNEIHGPAVTTKKKHNNFVYEVDKVMSLPCYNWPDEAKEWVSRPRLYNWPDKALRDQILQGGCHLVPVGDKTSAADQSLQWRISFVTAERKLMHSLTHVQFLVYGLLKYFLKQISGMLERILGETDIISSYIIKTVVLHAVESTTKSFWEEKHTFLCFMFCLKILINWVKAGHCPNYFIQNNNMFLGKVYGTNQKKLLRYLADLHDMNWKCLSVGTCIRPSIGERIHSVMNGEWEKVQHELTHTGFAKYLNIVLEAFTLGHTRLPGGLELLSASTSDIGEFIGYFQTVQALSHTGMKTFSEHVTATGNKEKYRSLRKCKNLLRPFATVSKSPGLLILATFYYQTGNYMKTLEVCGHVISAFKVYLFRRSRRDMNRYEQLYCGRGNNLLHKSQAFVSDITFTQEETHFCPSQLHPEIKQCPSGPVFIPPLPYAVFLSFLCYHGLGDSRRRDTALRQLRATKYDEEQGGSKNWIIQNLLGICFEMVGDTRRALMEYRESVGVVGDGLGRNKRISNPAMERIERLQHSQ